MWSSYLLICPFGWFIFFYKLISHHTNGLKLQLKYRTGVIILGSPAKPYSLSPESDCLKVWESSRYVEGPCLALLPHPSIERVGHDAFPLLGKRSSLCRLLEGFYSHIPFFGASAILVVNILIFSYPCLKSFSFMDLGNPSVSWKRIRKPDGNHRFKPISPIQLSHWQQRWHFFLSIWTSLYHFSHSSKLGDRKHFLLTGC